MALGASALREKWAPVERNGFPVMKGYVPGVGHTLALHFDAAGALGRAERELGPFVQVDLGFGNWYLFCFGAETFDLLKNKAVILAGSRESLQYLVGGALVTIDGAHHRHVRSAMSPTFSASGLSQSTVAPICCETVVEHVRRFVQKGGGKAHEHTQHMTLDVIFRIVGVSVSELEVWRSQYRKALWGLIPFPVESVGSPRYFAKKAVGWIDGQLAQMAERARSEEGQSMLHHLVRAKDEDGEPLSREDLIANLRLLFLAGHETTATTTAWALIHLARRPDLVRRLTAEVKAAGGTPPLTMVEAKKLALCEAVFRESVRLYGPAWFIERKLTEDITVHGATLPAGTIVALPAVRWARDERIYPNPEQFDPDRWLGKKEAPTPYELSQFGGGVHFCLGYHLAWLESVQYLAALVIALDKAQKELRLVAKTLPKVAYFPMAHPSPSPTISVE
ncbi:MAG: cytochrome P450 [Polyangiaceae bacterium]|nr:cytochrome P450 [Polyangiaceae bacterium]